LKALANPYVWNYGDMTATNLTTGDQINLHFKKKGWFSSKDYSVSGDLKDKNGNTL